MRVTRFGRSALSAAVVAVLALGNAACGTTRYYTGEEFDAAFATLKSCAETGLKKRAGTAGDKGLEKFATDNLLLTQLLLDVVASRQDKIADMGAFAFCERILVPEIVANYRQVVEDKRQERVDTKAKLGGFEISTANFVIDGYHNHYGKHIRGHADITLTAVAELLGKESDNGVYESAHMGDHKLSAEFLMRASQAPDIYRWSTPVYHAHTPDCDPSTPRGQCEPREQRIRAGLLEFIKTFAAHHQAALDANVQTANTPLVGFMHLGTMLHMAQDLVYHRGMTLLQHSGLSFLAGYKDEPDEPPGTRRGQLPIRFSAAYWRELEAIKISKLVLKAVLGAQTAARQLKFEKGRIKNTDQEYDEQAKHALWPQDRQKWQEFEKSEKMTGTNLIAYYRLATAFEKGQRYPEAELKSERIFWPDSRCLIEFVLKDPKLGIDDPQAVLGSVMKCRIEND